MDSMELPSEYDIAQGPEGLTAVLDGLLEKPKAEYFILYQLGDQKSLIKVNTHQMPYEFWYDDLLGRPATKAVKDVIVEFLWEKCGEKERHYKNWNEEGSL